MGTPLPLPPLAWCASSALPTGPSSIAWRSMSGFISGTLCGVVGERWGRYDTCQRNNSSQLALSTTRWYLRIFRLVSSIRLGCTRIGVRSTTKINGDTSGRFDAHVPWV